LLSRAESSSWLKSGGLVVVMGCLGGMGFGPGSRRACCSDGGGARRGVGQGGCEPGHRRQGWANIGSMLVNKGNNPTTHFRRQMKKERLARGWSLREFSARTGIDFATASRIENGKRPPTEKVATACDVAFPERRGWFCEYYAEMSTWSEVPAAF